MLTAQPSLDDRQIERKQMKLAMSVGDSRHCKIEEIRGGHFIQTAERAGLPGALAISALEEVTAAARAPSRKSKRNCLRVFGWDPQLGEKGPEISPPTPLMF